MARDPDTSAAPAGKIVKSDADWRQSLDAETYRVARKHGTERAFTSPLNNEKRAGTFGCMCCGAELFRSDDKFEFGDGLAELHASGRRWNGGRNRGQHAFHAAHGGALHPLRRPFGACVPGWAASDRFALLHQRRVAEVRGKALRPLGAGERCSACSSRFGALLGTDRQSQRRRARYDNAVGTAAMIPASHTAFDTCSAAPVGQAANMLFQLTRATPSPSASTANLPSAVTVGWPRRAIRPRSSAVADLVDVGPASSRGPFPAPGSEPFRASSKLGTLDRCHIHPIISLKFWLFLMISLF